jgi:outer membrane protein assembly factor BamB
MDDATTMDIRLLDASGHVVASTRFAPPAQPTLSNCADLLQPPVRIAGGAVYFADSNGLVQKLTRDGSVSQVATFKLTSKQQLVSYAVKPDGTQLIAIVISTPPLHVPPPQTIGDPVFGPGTWTLDLETATPGGSTTAVLHKDLGTAFPSPTVITGWDVSGPTATVSSAICTQAALPSWSYTGTLIHLAMDGTHLDRIGGSDCQAWDELTNGTVLCGTTDMRSFSVRRTDGTVIWSSSASGFSNARLAPDGNAVASADGAVYFRDNRPPAAFPASNGVVLGWIDPGSLVLMRQDGSIGLAKASDPPAFSALGLTLTGPCLTCVPYGAAVTGTLAGA